MVAYFWLYTRSSPLSGQDRISIDETPAEEAEEFVIELRCKHRSSRYYPKVSTERDPLQQRLACFREYNNAIGSQEIRQTSEEHLVESTDPSIDRRGDTDHVRSYVEACT